MSDTYQFVGMSHVTCVGMSVWFGTYHSDGRSVHCYGLVRRTMLVTIHSCEE